MSKLLDLENTYCIGDNHFWHKNIIKYENRPFSSVEEMNEVMIKNWNEVINNKSKVIILGDWIFGNKDNVESIVRRLKGYKILILGNHDQYSPSYYSQLGVEEVSAYPIIVDDFIMCSHHPMYISDNTPYINVFAHVHGNPEYKTISKQSACLSVERWGYKPVLLGDICRLIEKENN